MSISTHFLYEENPLTGWDVINTTICTQGNSLSIMLQNTPQFLSIQIKQPGAETCRKDLVSVDIEIKWGALVKRISIRKPLNAEALKSTGGIVWGGV